MNIAYTIGPGRGDTDQMLASLAGALSNKGVRLCGTVQVNTDRECDGPCDMDVQVLPDGPSIRISQSLGKESKGCRLNPDALEQAVGLATEQLRNGADVLIINKFGKHEADGRGFRDLIAEAFALEVPVLVGTNGINESAFVEFTDGYAERVEPKPEALIEWVNNALKAA